MKKRGCMGSALAAITLLLFTCPSSALTLNGETADAMASLTQGAGGPATQNSTQTILRAGRYDPDNGTPADNDSLHAAVVFPFLLPDHAPAGSPFSNATLTVTLDALDAGTDYSLDLYGIDARSSSSPVPGDFHFDLTDDPSPNTTKLESGILETNTPLGAVVSADISTWLNEQYAYGANTGQYIFLRFTPRADPTWYDVRDGYKLASANHATTSNWPVITYDLDSSPPPMINVALTHGVNGSIAPTGTVAIAQGSDLVITLNAADLYHTEQVLVNGSPTPFSSTLTLETLTSNTSVDVTFAANRNFWDVPDWWMNQWQTNWMTNLSLQTSADADNDGQPTWAEYHAGTNPTNADSYFRLDMSRTSGVMEVAFDNAAVDLRDQADGYMRSSSIEQGDTGLQQWTAVPGFEQITSATHRVTYYPPMSNEPGFFRAKTAMIKNGANPTNERPPNIILLLTDDLGWGDMHSQGHPYVQTPNIDRLAREGTVFDQYYVNASVCSPTRAGFMTGRYPAELEIHTHLWHESHNAQNDQVNFLDPNEATITSILQSNGYATGHFGKWHLGGTPGAPPPDAYGIDGYSVADGSGTLENPLANSAYFDQFTPSFASTYFINLSTHAIAYEAARFIEEHRHEPIYLNFWTKLPHAQLLPTPDQLAVYTNLVANPNDFLPRSLIYMQDAPNLSSQMKVYCASVTALDEGIGILLNTLEELGLAGNTLILFTSDNGPEDYAASNARNAGVGYAGPYRARKRSLYDGGIHMPCIVRWPEKVAVGGVNTNTIFSGVDWLPTVLNLAGIDVPAGLQLDGEDMSDVLMGSTRQRSGPLMWEVRFDTLGALSSYTSPQLAIRSGDWKLFTDTNGNGTELYHMPSDPKEGNNLAASSAHADTVSSLKDQVLAWKAALP